MAYDTIGKTYFSEMLEAIDEKLRTNAPGAEEIFKTYFENCHQFMFIPESEEVTTTHVPLTEEIIDLPFPCIHVEVLGRYITIPSPNDEKKVWIRSFIASEVAPREYRFLAHLEVDDKGQTRFFIMDIVKSVNLEVWTSYNSFLKVYLDKLSAGRVGVESAGMKIKLGSGKNKRFYKPSAITHVTSKKYNSPVLATIPSKNIDWSHRWEVRGHWREVKGLGKDRDGLYSVVNYTWVKNHSKGPENAPLVKKTYVVKE